MNNKFRYDINFLRAFSILIVILYHFKISGFQSGFIGVDIFFVISGYLMTAIIVNKLYDDRFSLLSFYKRRAQRLIPALYVMLTIMTAAFYFLLVPTDFEREIKAAVSSFFFSYNLFSIPDIGYFLSQERNFLLHMWSLGVEWQFYIVFPILLMCAYRLKISIFIAISTAFFLSFLLSMYYQYDIDSNAFFSPITRSWELLAGGLAYFLTIKRKAVAVSLGYGLIAISFFTADKANWPNWGAVLPVAGSVLVIASNLSVSFYKLRVFKFLGDISYSLYIYHWPVYCFLVYFSMHSLWLSGFISLFLSIASFYLVERQLINKKFTLLIISVSFLLLSFFSLNERKINESYAEVKKDELTKIRSAKLNMLTDDCFVTRNNPESFCFKKYQGGTRKVAIKDIEIMNKAVIYIGDRHSRMLAGVVAKSANEHAYDFFYTGHAGCAVSTANENNTNTCKVYNSKVIESLMELPRSTVVISNYWRKYASDNRIEAICNISSRHNVIVTSPLPVWDENYGREFYRKLFAFSYKTHKHTITREKFDIRVGELSYFNDFLNCGVTMIDLYEAFCDSEKCSYFSDAGLPLYVDKHHLSRYGVIRTKPFFDHEFSSNSSDR